MTEGRVSSPEDFLHRLDTPVFDEVENGRGALCLALVLSVAGYFLLACWAVR